MDDDPDFRIEETRSFDIKDGYIIVGFPSNSLEAATAVEAFRNMHEFSNPRKIAKLHSSLIENENITIDGNSVHHSRILLSNKLNIAIISSHMELESPHYEKLADVILEFACKHRVKHILTCGMINADARVRTVRLGSTGTTQAIIANARYQRSEIAGDISDVGLEISILPQINGGITEEPPIPNSMITGLPAVIINQGKTKKQDVIAVLANKNFIRKHELATKPGFGHKSVTELCERLSCMIESSNGNPPTPDYYDVNMYVDIYQSNVMERINELDSLNN